MHTLKRVVVALALMLVVVPFLSSTAQAKGPKTEVIELRDQCERESFDAEFGAGFCAYANPSRDGSVSLAEFRAELADGGHGAWWNRKREITLDRGDRLRATNVGGIVHTFTEVAQFGAGCIPEWNQAVPGQPSVCDFTQFGATLVPQGSTSTAVTPTVGRHLFQCLVHPWMRTVVTVEAD
jgi:plastocyanin